MAVPWEERGLEARFGEAYRCQLLRQLQDIDEMRHEVVAAAGLEPRPALLCG